MNISTDYYFQYKENIEYEENISHYFGYEREVYLSQIRRLWFKRVNIRRRKFIVIGYNTLELGSKKQYGSDRIKLVKCMVININQGTQKDIEFGYLYFKQQTKE